MSFIRNILRLGALRRPRYYVGSDLEGNTFFERPSTSDDPRRTKRSVTYHQKEDMWKYIGGGKRLAVQWSSWLSHTRTDPPAIEELQADAFRQARVRANAALIEARDREERENLLRIGLEMTESPFVGSPSLSKELDILGEASLKSQADVAADSAPRGPPADQSDDSAPRGPPADRSDGTARPSHSELPKMAKEPEYQPQSWIPRASRRADT